MRNKMTLTTLAMLSLVISGCAPSLVHSNSAGGVISLAGVVQEQRKAMILAGAECAKHGKVAVAKGQNILTDTLRYECS